MKTFQVDVTLCLRKESLRNARYYNIGMLVSAVNAYDACIRANDILKSDFQEWCKITCHFEKVEEVECYDEKSE